MLISIKLARRSELEFVVLGIITQEKSSPYQVSIYIFTNQTSAAACLDSIYILGGIFLVKICHFHDFGISPVKYYDLKVDSVHKREPWHIFSVSVFHQTTKYELRLINYA